MRVHFSTIVRCQPLMRRLIFDSLTLLDGANIPALLYGVRHTAGWLMVPCPSNGHAMWLHVSLSVPLDAYHERDTYGCPERSSSAYVVVQAQGSGIPAT
jgi:hypothetical protein